MPEDDAFLVYNLNIKLYALKRFDYYEESVVSREHESKLMDVSVSNDVITPRFRRTPVVSSIWLAGVCLQC